MKKGSKTLAVLLLLALVGAAVWYLYPHLSGILKPRPTPGPVAGKLVVRFLDIGQGDAELIQLPGGETILIDSGDRGAPTVNLLKQYGVNQIDLLIASHPHADHIGEMRDIMREFPVKEFWDAGFPYTTTTYRDMLQEIKDRGIPFKAPRRGDTRKVGDATLEVLHPGAQFISTDSDEANNASIVVRLTYGGKRFLFTGDAEEAAWRQMIETGKDKLRADLLKAAHHGSSDGTTDYVLEAVRPSVVTISCKAGNDYHHPHPKVMDLLESRAGDIDLYRTDMEGTITATCDGNTIEMSAENRVAKDRLYLTGDEVAGKVASDGRGSRSSGRRGSMKGK
ncbi:MAG TPA: MBL fold metallo-hydrolase [Blastocatellia bacterium]|nr:MBL fold metallo-hydrolase [Blastocatellia bacterium]